MKILNTNKHVDLELIIYIANREHFVMNLLLNPRIGNRSSVSDPQNGDNLF